MKRCKVESVEASQTSAVVRVLSPDRKSVTVYRFLRRIGEAPVCMSARNDRGDVVMGEDGYRSARNAAVKAMGYVPRKRRAK